MSKRATIETVATPWRDVVLVCRKCSKRVDGGFGKKSREPLRKVLRETLRAAGFRRQVRIMEIGCVGLCPKRAVTIARASRPGELLVVPSGSEPADLLGYLAAVPPAQVPGSS